jgi:Tfp pilus assembly protein PilF
MKKIILVIGLLMFLGCTSAETKDKKEHFLIRGMNYSKEGKYSKAIEEYQKFYDLDKKDPILLREMGLAYAHLKEYEIAEKYYLEAIELDPKDQVTLTNLSILYYKMDNFEKSEEYLAMISNDSMDYRLFLLKGYISYDEGKYEESYQSFHTVLNMIRVEDYTFVKKYVDILQRTNRTNEIYPFIYSVYQAQKDNPEAVIDYSVFLIDVFNDYDGAFKALKVYNAQQKNDHIILELAQRSFEVGKLEDSETYLKLLTDAYKYDTRVLRLKRDIALKKGNKKEADKYSKILEKVSDLKNEKHSN